MSGGIALETPLAEALSSVVHTKITDEGWSQEDDTSLAEYIVLMLVNGKTQDQIASELASELLQDVDGIPEFAHWLTEQVDMLRRSTGPNTTVSAQSLQGPTSQNPTFTAQTEVEIGAQDNGAEIPAAYDTDMGEMAPDNAPRGPKGMHGGRPAARGGRIVGQVNKAMDRTNESVLHRVRPQSGTERINSHVRGAPKGPRTVQNREVRPAMQKALNGMASQPMSNPMMQTSQNGQPMMPMSPQQQLEFMSMMEQQARMMAQFMPGMIPTASANPGFQQNGQQQQTTNGRSLFDRVEPGRGRGGRGRGRGASHGGNGRNSLNKPTDVSANPSMGVDVETEDGMPIAMDAEQSSQPSKPGEPATTMCRFNLRCINKDCPYVHQSPAAPEGTVVDMTNTCSFGVTCKNSKCVGKHPSPALIKAHQSEEICRYHPNCTNPSCGFKHPNMPLCKNGGDCNVENCKFVHLQTACRFKPCLNPRCPYKHEDGQRGTNKWSADGNNQHVSERKYVADGEEELIKPENGSGSGESQQMTQNGVGEGVIS